MTSLPRDTRLYLAGHTGLVGSAIHRKLQAEGFTNILTRTHAQLDLTDQAATRAFFERERPEVVVLAAARVGGILANSTYPADFLRDNLAIALNVIGAAHEGGVSKLLNLGSSCIYPRLAPQPIPESALLTGPLEDTNRAYAIAKIAAIELCDSYRRQHGDDFVSAMPTNLYGPGDNYDPHTSHVLAALIRKIHQAKETGAETVTIWGTGEVRREFLHADDLAGAALYLLEHVSEPGPINVGTGKDITINELAHLIADVIGFQGAFEHDTSKPDGTPRKLLDVSKLRDLGWEASTGLREGIARTYRDYLSAHRPA
ncbi:MAG TPA: GDP-L-fucose synthase [Trueperaceae bacterium]|nr:GDP-L-fucose synthase [Trueperaceae bacterium]